MSISARVRRSVYSSSSPIVSRIVSRPCRATSACTRRTPVALAAICARKSPAVSCFERIWARIEPEDVVDDRAAGDEPDGRDDDALLEDLAERADRGGRPAADVDVVREVRHVAEQLVPRRRRGRSRLTSFRCTPLGCGSFVTMTSPGPSLSGPYFRTALGTCSTIEPRCTGCANPCATERSSRVEERAREVGARLDVRRVRAPLQREHHLVRRRDERVPDHLERDRVDGRAHDARSSAVAASSSSRPVTATR